MLNKILDESGRLPRACANVAGIPTGKNCLKSLSFLGNIFFHCCVGMRVRERLSKICIAPYNPGLTVFFFCWSKNKMQWNNKPLIQCFGRYYTWTFYSLLGFFLAPAGPWKNTTLLVKYPLILSTKRPNKVYVCQRVWQSSSRKRETLIP